MERERNGERDEKVAVWNETSGIGGKSGRLEKDEIEQTEKEKRGGEG